MARFSGIFKSKQFLKFILAGGLAASINFGSRFVYSYFVEFELAVVLAFCTGLTSGYILSKALVFPKGRHSRNKEAGYFLIVNLIALLQTWLISIILASYILPMAFNSTISEAAGHLTGVIFPVFTSYIGHKYFTFSNSHIDTDS